MGVGDMKARPGKDPPRFYQFTRPHLCVKEPEKYGGLQERMHMGLGAKPTISVTFCFPMALKHPFIN